MRKNRFARVDGTGRQLALTVALFICGTAGLQAQLGQNKKDNAATDMTNVQDVLSGKRTLLRDDDIQYGTISTSVGQGYILKTQNSTIIRPTAAPGSTGTAPPGGYLYKPSPFYGIATGVGRMQAIDADTSITLQPTSSGWQVDAVNYGTPGYNRTYTLPTSYQPYGTNYTQVVMGDFDGSYTKQAVLYYSSSSSIPTVAIRIARSPKGAPPDDPQLQFGPEYVQQGVGIGPVVNVGTLTVGDFNGDGYDEVAALLTDNHTLVVFTVDRTTYELKPYATMGLNWNNTNISLSPVALAAGRYRDNVELVAVGQITGGTRDVMAVPIGVTISTDSKGNSSASFATQAPQKIVGYPFPLAHIQAQAAAVGDWASATGEQLVYAAYSVFLGTPLAQIGVMSFASDWTASMNSFTSGEHCSYGLAVGNFDHRQSDSSRNPSLQIAILGNDTSSCSADSVEQQQWIRIFDIKPLSPNPPGQSPPNLLTQVSQYNFDGVHDNVAATISFGDLQGRSVTVGPPSIVTITDQRQPDIILGVPPMHADWILPPSGTTLLPGCADQKGNPKYCLYNFTFFPTEEPSYGAAFNTAFVFSDTSNTNSERNATTSWGIGVKQTVGLSTTFSDPGVDSVSVDIKNTAQYTHDSTVSKTYNKYQSFSQSISDTTGSADHIFYTERTHNIYYYPVLGAAGCPDANPNCSSSERRYISFSVPDNIQRADEDGTLKHWYNPVQEPGNIFSYPWTFAQLSGQFSEPVSALTNPSCQATGTKDKESLTATWSNGSSTTQSAASSNQFSDELSTTISDTAGVKDVESATFSYTLDITGSTSLKTLNVGKQVLDSSTGVITLKPGFPGYIFGYGFRNYILGIGSSNPAYQTFANLNPNPDSNTTLPDQKTGPLIVSYLANPLAASNQELICGGDTALAWQKVYNKPDVALNHPQRLTWSKSS